MSADENRLLAASISRLESTLSVAALDLLRHLIDARGQAGSFCTGEILYFGLRVGCDVGRACDLGVERSVCVHSASLSADLQRWRQRDPAVPFAPDERYLANDSLAALKRQLADGETLFERSDVGHVFLPLNTTHQHWSLLVVDVSRATVEHFDSLAHVGWHKQLARDATQMLLDCGLLPANPRILTHLSVTPQRSSWECGFAVVLFAQTYVRDGAFAARSTSLDAAAITRLAQMLFRKAKSGELCCMFSSRLRNYFVAL